MENQAIFTLLKQFKELLLEEKDVLIKNDGKRLQEIVAEKEQYIEHFDTAEIPESDKEKAHQLIQEIQALQETNLTLTKQAMSFGEAMLQALQKSSQQKSVTYSKPGKNNDSKGPGLLDQSL